jgi:hypothetical protein
MSQGTAVARAKLNPQLPASLKEEFSREALAIKDAIGAPSGDFIGCTKNKTFRLPGSGTEAPEITAIIVDWVTFNQYYPGAYNPKNLQPAVCASLGKVIKDLVPLDGVPDPQSEGCEGCPKNEWGSAGNGSKGKACKNQRLLALLPPDNPAEGPLMLLKVAPTGIKNFDNYVSKFANSNGIVPHPISVVTRIKFDQSSEYSLLVFEADGVNNDLEAAAARRKEAQLRLLTPPDFGPRTTTVGK